MADFGVKTSVMEIMTYSGRLNHCSEMINAFYDIVYTLH